MTIRVAVLFCLLFCTQSFAEDVAVFPVQGVNLDRSFADAFGALLAKKYSSVSGKTVIAPVRAAKAIGPDSSLVQAALNLGVAEYLQIDAVGLYLSRKEQNEIHYDSAAAGGQVIIIREREKGRERDQDKLDNSKTVVTVTRMTSAGARVHQAELTLLTYGDIEESTERFALSLHKKIPIDQTRSTTNITRREGMGHNRLFAERVTGVKMGGFYVLSHDASFTPMVSIGYNMKADSERFFLEFGAGGLIPSSFLDSEDRMYGGNYFEIGGSYYLLNGVTGLYLGGGVVPFFNWLRAFEMGIAPFAQVGVMLLRNSKTRFYFDIRVLQNILPITTEDHNAYDIYPYERKIHRDFPTQIGFEIGIGW